MMTNLEEDALIKPWQNNNFGLRYTSVACQLLYPSEVKKKNVKSEIVPLMNIKYV